MAQVSSHLTETPFGEVNAWRNEDGSVRVKATVQMKPSVEHARTGLAIDGSNSMSELFGGDTQLSAFFSGLTKPNLVQPVARKISEYLSQFDSNGQVRVIYYACGPAGSQIQEIGQLDAQSIPKTEFALPKSPGRGTQICPAMRYFCENFADVPWTICLFVTDGLLDDLEQAKALSKQICEEMKDGRRGFIKFVIIGLGSEFSSPDTPASRALSELDDLDEDPEYGVEGQDLWDYKLARDLKTLDEIFAEVVSDQVILCSGASVVDSLGKAVIAEDGSSYSDALPALLRFTMSAGATAFTLHLPNGMSVTQDISSVL